MKLAIAVLAAIALSASAARADQVPKVAVGKWCFLEKSENADHYIYKDCGEDDWLVVKPDRFEAPEMVCRFVSVKTRFDRTIDATTKTKGASVASVSARCSGENCEWGETFTMYVSKGVLVMKDNKASPQKCKQK